MVLVGFQAPSMVARLSRVALRAELRLASAASVGLPVVGLVVSGVGLSPVKCATLVCGLCGVLMASLD